MTANTKMKGAAALLGAAFTYASLGVLIREMSKMFGNNAQVAFRYVLAFVFMALIALLIKRPVKITRRTLLKVALLGITFSGVVAFFTIAVNLTTLGNSVFLLYAGSIISSLLIGTLALKEKLTPIKIAAVTLALIGLCMYSSELLTLSLGLVAAVLSGLLDGVSNAIRKTLRGIDRNTVLLYQFAFGSAWTLLVLMIVPEQAIREVSLLPVLAGIIFAAVLVGLGNLLLYGFQHFDVHVGTVILASELLFASLFGWIFFSEVPAQHELIGGLVIFLASILSAADVPSLVKRRHRAAAGRPLKRSRA